MSRSLRVEQALVLKYYLKPFALIFWQDLRQSIDRFLTNLLPKIVYNVVLVINVDLKSRWVSKEALGEAKYLANPLSLILLHFASLSTLRLLKFSESDIAFKVLLEQLVQLRSK